MFPYYYYCSHFDETLEKKQKKIYVFKSPNACSKIRRDSQSTLQFAYQGKDIVFNFIIEYSSLRDFGP
jgi:hypothetical protein